MSDCYKVNIYKILLNEFFPRKINKHLVVMMTVIMTKTTTTTTKTKTMTMTGGGGGRGSGGRRAAATMTKQFFILSQFLIYSHANLTAQQR